MKIDKLILLNWGVLNDGEFIFDRITSITGETGVGKSSIGDAIQTIMGAALESIITYNAGQDESHQGKKKNRERRSHAGYVAGEDQFIFARPNGCTGTISLSFKPSPGEDAEPFTAILNTTVEMEEKKDGKTPKVSDYRFFIIKNTDLALTDFVGSAQEVLDHRGLNRIFKIKYRDSELIEYPGKEGFLMGLYGHLWGKATADKRSAYKAAKAFCNFINAKPVEDINSFIRNDFLNQKDMRLQIERMSDSLRALEKITKEGKEIGEGIKLSKGVVSLTDSIVEKWIKNKTDHFRASYLRLIKRIHENNEKIKEINKAAGDQIEYEKEINNLREERKATESTLQGLNAALQGSETQAQKNSIETRMQNAIKESEAHRSDLIIPLSNTIQSLNGRIDSIREQDLPGHHSFFRSLNALKRAAKGFADGKYFFYFTGNSIKNEGEDYQDKVRRFSEDVGFVLNSVHEMINSEEVNADLNSINEMHMNAIVTFQTKKAEIEEVADEISELEANKTILPPHIKKELVELKELLPDIDVRMLYEFVDVPRENDEWRNAIEGFLGNARFSLIAEEEHEIEVLNAINRHNLNLSIVQGKKVQSDLKRLGKALNADSIVNFLNFSHPVAEAYMYTTFGNVLAIDTYEELRMAKRGITRDCSVANANLMSVRRPKDGRLMLGAEGRKRTLEALKEKEALLRSEYDQAVSKKATIDKVLKITEDIKDMYNRNEKYISGVNAFEGCLNDYLEAKRQLSLLDLSDIEDMVEAIEKENKRIEGYDIQISDLNKMIGRLENLLDNREHKIKTIEEENSANENRYNLAKEDYAGIYNTYKSPSDESATSRIEKLEKGIPLSHPAIPTETISESLSSEWIAFKTQYNSRGLQEAEKIQVSLDFNHNELQDHPAIFRDVFNLGERFKQEVVRLESDIRNRYQEEFEEADEKFKQVFFTDFCLNIYNSIKDGENSIEDLNNILRTQKFESDSYQIQRLDPAPIYKDYKKYFKKVYELKDLAGDPNSLTGILYAEELKDTTDELISLIKENKTGHAEILKLSDYRNYSNYDIIQTIGDREISLSRNGKMSGGQGETAYNVIRSINLHAALKPQGLSNSSLETVLMDETFTKTSESRAKEMIAYVTETMGFQMIFALASKNVGALHDVIPHGYHLVKSETGERTNGELNYVTFAIERRLNGDEISDLFARNEEKMRGEIERAADLLFGVEEDE